MSDVEIEKQKMATYSATIPHLFLEELFDVTEIMPIIEAANAKKQNISLLSILIKACSMALSAHPKINSTYKLNNQFNYNIVSQQNLLLPIYGKLGLGYSLLGNLEKLSIVGIQNTSDNVG